GLGPRDDHPAPDPDPHRTLSPDAISPRRRGVMTDTAVAPEESPAASPPAATAARRNGPRRHPLANVIGVVAGLIWLIPGSWKVNSRLQPESELISWPPDLGPAEFPWENFVTAFNNANFLPALRASLIAGGLTVLFASSGAVLASFALSRFRF